MHWGRLRGECWDGRAERTGKTMVGEPRKVVCLPRQWYKAWPRLPDMHSLPVGMGAYSDSSFVLISNKSGSCFGLCSKLRGRSVLQVLALIYLTHLPSCGVISTCPCKGTGVMDASAM